MALNRPTLAGCGKNLIVGILWHGLDCWYSVARIPLASQPTSHPKDDQSAESQGKVPNPFKKNLTRRQKGKQGEGEREVLGKSWKSFAEGCRGGIPWRRFVDKVSGRVSWKGFVEGVAGLGMRVLACTYLYT